METGFAFGLFAIFSIIRYRTKQIPIKEMTFLFISIILATINSTVTTKISIFMILFANVTILASSFIMERTWKKDLVVKEQDILVHYNNIPLINPTKERELLNDLENKLGFPIKKVWVKSVDLTEETAELIISI